MYKTRKQRLAYAKQYREKNRELLNKENRERYYRTINYQRKRAKKFYEENKIAFLAKSRRNYIKNSSVVCKRAKMWAKNNPVKYRLSMILTGIKGRCKNPKHIAYKYYGKRGIKCFLKFKDMVYLWNRDKAFELKKPSIDRINNDGNYELSNCRYIELSENIRKKNAKIN